MFVVYRTIPTSNHNWTCRLMLMGVLYIVLFLHQTTTGLQTYLFRLRCISYYSYIKPQLRARAEARPKCCISYYSYIKPQLQTIRTNVCRSCISYYSYIKPQLFRFAPTLHSSCISYYSYIKPQRFLSR